MYALTSQMFGSWTYEETQAQTDPHQFNLQMDSYIYPRLHKYLPFPYFSLGARGWLGLISLTLALWYTQKDEDEPSNSKAD